MSDKNQAHEFCMGFVSASEKYREQFLDKWEEILSNFIVEPSQDWASPQHRNSPYKSPPRMGRTERNQIILKDPETHKLVMTYAAKLVRVLFGDRNHEYVIAQPVGYEDVQAAQTVTRLLRYCFSRPGHFRTLVESIIDMLLFGTSVVEVVWKYEEREMPVRSVSSMLGVETSTTARVMVPYYDDACIRPLDVFDFYPDPGRYRIEDMSGAAKRFRMNKNSAKQMADSELWDSAAVTAAIDRGGSSQRKSQDYDNEIREGIDMPYDRVQHSDFQDMIGYEYWGEVPWGGRRVITIWNNELVRDEEYPLADPHLPFHSMIINPMHGRFYGISPAEIVRYDQSFADALKMLLATAIVRKVNPPVAVDLDGDCDEDAVSLWTSKKMIKVRGGPGAIGALRYDADTNAGLTMWQAMIQNIQGGSGATGAVQGEEGPDREPATVGALRLQAAMDRPELAAMVLEEECLPPIAQAFLRRNQQFLEDTEDLRKRIGEQPESVWLGTIMGEFDVRFMGSRRAMSRQMKLQSVDRLTAMGTAWPELRGLLPMQDLATWLTGDLLELPEIAAKIADPRQVMMNVLLQGLMGGGSSGGAGSNGVASLGQPPGAMPAQMGGGIQ